MFGQTHLEVAAVVDARIKPQATSMIAVASSMDEVVGTEVTKPPVTRQEHPELNEIVRMLIPHEIGKEACGSLRVGKLCIRVRYLLTEVGRQSRPHMVSESIQSRRRADRRGTPLVLLPLPQGRPGYQCLAPEKCRAQILQLAPPQGPKRGSRSD